LRFLFLTHHGNVKQHPARTSDGKVQKVGGQLQWVALTCLLLLIEKPNRER
jgi:hypothetical protein